MRYDTKKKDPFYGSAAWRRLRIAALQRDHYWCRRCGKRQANTVHHLIPREDAPELALDLDNLESVCPQCHNQIHDEKGRKENRAPVNVGGLRVEVI